MKTLQHLWKPLVVAVLLRSAWGLLIPVMPVSDSGAYVIFARMLAEYGVFGFEPDRPFAFWPPGTSFVYAAVFAVFGDNLQWAVPANILMSVALIWTTARVAERFHSPAAALAAAWIIALWPTLIVYVTIVASELPFVLLITLAIDAWTSERNTLPWRTVLAGALLGAAALVRPLALVFPFLLVLPVLLAAWRARAGFGRAAARLALCVVTMFIVVLPWTLRNADLYDRTVLISTNGGITFWMGNTPGTNGGYMEVPAELAHLSDADIETELRARAWEYIRAEPVAFATRSLEKAVRLYVSETIGVWWNEPGITRVLGKEALLPLKIVTQAGWMAVLLLGILGAWRVIRDGPWLDQLLSPVVLPIIALTAIHGLTVSQDRYHLGFCSLLAVLAAVGASVVFRAAGRIARRA